MKMLKKICLFILVAICLSTISVSASTGYTYDHKGKVIYSTDGFTVNETPYIYSDLGIDNSSKFKNPTDLYVYTKDENLGTIVYLLDGTTASVDKETGNLSHSTLFMMDSSLTVYREIAYLFYNPNKLSDNELLTMKSAKTNVVSASGSGSSADPSDPTMAANNNGFTSLEDVRSYETVKLYMSDASAVYRMYKTNTKPYTDYLYICDTGNNQVLVVDATSYDADLMSYEIVKVITSPLEELGDPATDQDATTFRPQKVTVDAAGRVYVIANGVTNGIMEFSEDGSFDRYIGTNYVTLSAWDIFWRNFSTESQLNSSESILPTTFTSMTYKNNMIYATSYVVTSSDGVTTNDTIMIKKINPSGKDVLRRNGYTVPKGDYTYYKSNDTNGKYGPSTFEGIAVNDYGIYTVVDSNRGRLFTYDNEGNLLYISGGTGEQIDKISIPKAIQYLGENILVLDGKKNAIILFEPTDIAKVINKAIECEYDGRIDGEYYDDDNDPTTPEVYRPGAYDYWEQVILLNANYEYAYVGIGKHYFNIKEYKTAMEYFKLGYEKIYYGKAYKEYRDGIIKANFAWVACVVIGLVLAGIIFKKVRRKKLGIKDEVMTGIGDE